MAVLLANNTASAGESFGQVFVWFLMVVGTLALIYAVLAVLDRRYKKNGGDKPAESEKKDPKTFSEVLSDKIEQKKKQDDDGSRRV